MEFKGSKYEAGRNTTVCAKLMREDIKAAMASGELPRGLKTTVKTRKFAGGSAIDIHITGGLDSLLNPEYPRWCAMSIAERGANYAERPNRYTESADAVLKALTAIGNQYLYSDIDGMSDYYNVNFFFNVAVDSSYDSVEYKALAEYLAATG